MAKHTRRVLSRGLIIGGFRIPAGIRMSTTASRLVDEIAENPQGLTQKRVAKIIGKSK